ncbi:hypothetical protein IC757_12430 [Wenzhouxiangella sp. AB-CW3]|uniref:hypothetical protein n=1 Tax=Wenzhouxiangella sp. AB-CW3 TaxID=2771012 RepID=UPI00168B1754|nr:hypothetical protein [Wenzhouxiangella sp. AB-CW3]QOC21832.1 hypothetical protein IC757_12430 [Wenzhouxiangella sp. AB-CW3]
MLMKQPNTKVLKIVIGVPVAILAVIALVWWLLERPAERPGEDPLREESHAVVGSADGDAERSGSRGERFSSPSGGATEAREVRKQTTADPFSEGQSIKDALQDAESLYGWSERQAYGNQVQWLHWCEEIGAAASSPPREVNVESIRRKFPGMLSRTMFAQLCYEFVDEMGDAINEMSVRLADEFILQRESQVAAEPPQWMLDSVEIEELHRAGFLDRAREQVMRELDQALSRLDEGSVYAALASLILPEAELIAPPIAGDDGSYQFYWDAHWLVTVALICREVGGCRGEQHPMVLRQCAVGMPRNTGCYEPVDIFDAIYQTTTPVEHTAFSAFYEQVVSMLSAYRRRQ